MNINILAEHVLNSIPKYIIMLEQQSNQITIRLDPEFAI